MTCSVEQGEVTKLHFKGIIYALHYNLRRANGRAVPGSSQGFLKKSNGRARRNIVIELDLNCTGVSVFFIIGIIVLCTVLYGVYDSSLGQMRRPRGA